MGYGVFHFCGLTSMVNAVPLKLLQIVIKFQNFVKYTLKLRKTATVSETENMYDIICFFFL